MKKESVRQKEARDKMKRQAAQVAATVGIAGGGTAFAANAFAGGHAEGEEIVGQSNTDQQAASCAPLEVQSAPLAAHDEALHQTDAAAQPAPQSAAVQSQMSAAIAPQIGCAASSDAVAVEIVSDPEMEVDAVEIVDSGSSVETFSAFSAVSGAYTVGSVMIEDPDGAFEEIDCGEVEIEPLYTPDMMMSGDHPAAAQCQGIEADEFDDSDITGAEIDFLADI